MHTEVAFAAGLLGIWGISNCVGAARTAEAPTLRRSRLFSGLAGIGLALGIGCLAFRFYTWGLILAAAGLAAGVAWLYVVFRQSLNNTTM